MPPGKPLPHWLSLFSRAISSRLRLSAAFHQLTNWPGQVQIQEFHAKPTCPPNGRLHFQTPPTCSPVRLTVHVKVHFGVQNVGGLRVDRLALVDVAVLLLDALQDQLPGDRAGALHFLPPLRGQDTEWKEVGHQAGHDSPAVGAVDEGGGTLTVLKKV